MKKYLSRLRKNPFELVFFACTFLFSFWLMTSTFSYNAGQIEIASKAWSDFSSHIPLIRSFSFGDNFPPEYPLFAGPPIHYHFVFYMLVGLFEKIGIRIDIALNTVSITGFFLLTVFLYFFAKKLFSSVAVGVLTVLFFLFNSSGSFVYFFRNNPNPTTWLSIILQNTSFPAFGPYDGKLVSAFWNLNIYTNQRHLALAYVVSLAIISVSILPILRSSQKEDERKKFHFSFYELLRKEKAAFLQQSFTIGFLLGILLGATFFLHLAILVMTCIVLAGIALFFRNVRYQILVTLLTTVAVALPQYAYLNSDLSSQGAYSLTIAPGYLARSTDATMLSYMWYWVANLGASFILIPIGAFLAKPFQRKILLAFFLLFIVGNIFQFSPEVAANHKFFNYFILIGNMFSAFIIVLLWKKTLLKPIAVMLTFFMLLSGIIDFFPIYNDTKITIADYPTNKDIAWIKENTPKDAAFLNTDYLMRPESLAGRKIYLGWPYFAWSAGYDTQARTDTLRSVLQSSSNDSFCTFLKNNNLTFVSLQNPSTDFPYDPTFFSENFTAVYENPANNLAVYSTETMCE